MRLQKIWPFCVLRAYDFDQKKRLQTFFILLVVKLLSTVFLIKKSFRGIWNWYVQKYVQAYYSNNNEDGATFQRCSRKIHTANFWLLTDIFSFLQLVLCQLKLIDSDILDVSNISLSCLSHFIGSLHALV